jgi:cytochrome c553
MNTSRLYWFAAVLMFGSAAAPAATTPRQDFNAILALRPDVNRGQEIFTQCARCHGAEGAGVDAGTTPRIAGQHYRVLVKQLAAFRRGERWDFQMEGVATSHDVIPELQDIADVARYVSQLEATAAPGTGTGQFIEQGAKIYAARCASCHGAKGEGNDRREIPRIAGQHSGYVMRQIYDAVDGRRPPLTRTHAERFKPLSFEEVQGLADYIARMGWDAERAQAAQK